MSEPESAEKSSNAPLSLSRLTAAFARMLGSPGSKSSADDESLPRTPDRATPEGIVEAMLFVGRPDDSPLAVDEIAAAIRDVTPEEVDAIAERLNETYASDGAARRIVRSAAGYRMTLSPEFDRLRDRLLGRVKPARLSPTAIEVLSIVAYRQPIDSDEVEALRGKRSSSALAQLVRRGLLRRDSPASGEGTVQFHTTDRFLRLFDLGTLDQLPRTAELDD